MTENPKEKSPEKGTPAGSRFRIQANRIDSVTQSERIDTLNQTFGDTYHAEVKGSGAIAQGPGSKAAGSRGVVIGGDATGPIITGDGNTVINSPQRGGIRAATLNAENVVDGIQVRNMPAADLAKQLRNLAGGFPAGGISADRITAQNVVSGLQMTRDRPAGDPVDFWKAWKPFAAEMRRTISDRQWPTPRDADDLDADLKAIEAEAEEGDPSGSRIIRKLGGIADVLATALNRVPQPQERTMRLARQTASLLQLARQSWGA